MTKLTRHGIYRYSWQPEIREYVGNRVYNVLQLLSCWHETFEAEPDLTFGDLMRVLREIAPEGNAYLDCLLDTNLAPFLEEAFKPPSKTPSEIGITRLEVFWHGEIERREGKLAYVDAQDCFHAWGPPEEGATADSAEHIAWSVSLTPLCDLMHLPLVFNTTWRPRYDTSVFVDPSSRKGSRASRKRYHQDLDQHLAHVHENPEIEFPMAAIDRPFTLGWALRTIFMDLGFYGSPSERGAVKMEIQARYNSIPGEEAAESRPNPSPWDEGT